MAKVKPEFEYDPEENEDKSAALRLPFALCKEHGIEIQDWWTPRNAWEALKRGGYVQDPSEEMKKYFKELKRKQGEISRKKAQERAKRKEAQLADPEQNPTKPYEHEDTKIAGASRGKEMTFEEADNGKVNPNFNVKGSIGYRHNCQTCVAVYIARRKGYDVKALPNLNNRNIFRLSVDCSLAYKDKDGNNPKLNRKPRGSRTDTWLQENIEEGKLYSIEFKYAGKQAGHIITVEKNNGNIEFYDPQTNKKFSSIHPSVALRSTYGNIENIGVMSLSDVEMDEEFCDSIMKPAKSFEQFGTQEQLAKKTFDDINAKRMGK